MSDLLLDQYTRLLAHLDTGGDAATMLEESGFLDILVAEADGGAGLTLNEFFPLVLATGQHPAAADVIACIVQRSVSAPSLPLLAALNAAEMAGAIAAVEVMTIDYARTRKQFGREIGRFQAVQQQLAVMAEETVAARMAAEIAMSGSPADIDERAAAVAKLRCNRSARQVAAIAHAVHGAMGVSEEYPLHRFTGRLRQLSLQHGGEAAWAGRLGAWMLEDARDIVTLASQIGIPPYPADASTQSQE